MASKDPQSVDGEERRGGERQELEERREWMSVREGVSRGEEMVDRNKDERRAERNRRGGEEAS